MCIGAYADDRLRNLVLPQPLIVPDDWDNIISFYTGAIGQIISQDRVGTSNSKSFDFVDIDEAKFVNFERLKDETFPANRGQQKEFRTCTFITACSLRATCHAQRQAVGS